jgi:subtilisin family serine protease
MRKSSLLWRLAALTVLFSLLVTSASIAAPAQADPRDKVAAAVLAATADGQTTDFLVVMAEQADVSAAYQLPTKQAKGRYVYDTLSSTANRTQAGIKAYLDSQGIAYKSYFSINMLWTQGGQDLVLGLAARPEVGSIAANPRVRADLPVASEPAPTSSEVVEWNIMRVNADDVWAMGYTGQGMVVMTADTGVQWDHPALRDHYRGWNGSAADHNFNWWDAIQTTTVPIDPYGHGTHVTGTQVGDDPSHTNQVGVAPGAKWTGCRNMDAGGNGTPQSYTECIDFALAPWDLNQQNPNPALAPDAINNSWGCPVSEGCTDPNILLTPISNLRAAGIVFAAAAGNSGPGCSSISDPPGIYDPSTTVAATTNGATNPLASFSSRGPVTRDGSNRRKPDISAPGSGVRSSSPPNTYSTSSGTSMATPHIAGGVALLLSARPALQGNVDAIEAVLFGSANRTAVSSATTCGGTPYNVFPNNMYGYGILDLQAAVSAPTAVELSQLAGTTQSNQPQMLVALGLLAVMAASFLGVALLLRKRAA